MDHVFAFFLKDCAICPLTRQIGMGFSSPGRHAMGWGWGGGGGDASFLALGCRSVNLGCVPSTPPGYTDRSTAAWAEYLD